MVPLIAAFAIFCIAVDSVNSQYIHLNNCTFDCPRNGHFANPHNKYTYIQCTNGEPIIRRCPRGEDDLGYQVFKGQKCCENFDCPQLNGKYRHFIDEKLYYLCSDNCAAIMRCPAGYMFDGIDSCIDLFLCPKMNGKYRHPRDPYSYYMCCYGNPTLNKCPFDQHFNERNAKCEVYMNDVCVEPDGRYPYAKNPSQYYWCINGVHRLVDCPPGYVFDDDSRHCFEPWKCPQMDGRFINPVNHSQYYLCCNGTPELRHCPSRCLFDSATNRCQKAPPFVCPNVDGVFAHPLNDSQYYQCSNDIPLLQYCPVGYKYDPGARQCIPIPCADGTRFNVTTGRCDPIPCPPGHRYDLISKICVQIPCPQHTRFNYTTGQCDPIVCLEGYYYDYQERRCVRIKPEPCPEHTIYNYTTKRCEIPIGDCPIGSHYDERQRKCIGDVDCPEGTQWNPASKHCEYYPCSEGYYFNYTLLRCEPKPRPPPPRPPCPSGYHYNPRTRRCEIIIKPPRPPCPRCPDCHQCPCPQCPSCPQCQSCREPEKIPNPINNCQYYECSNNDWHRRTCPSHTVYDESNQRCMQNEIYRCRENYCVNPPEYSHYCPCKHMRCPRIIYDGERCVEPFRCPEPRGNYKHDWNRHQYYQCQNGGPSLRQCSAGYVYDSRYKTCVKEMAIDYRVNDKTVRNDDIRLGGHYGRNFRDEWDERAGRWRRIYLTGRERQPDMAVAPNGQIDVVYPHAPQPTAVAQVLEQYDREMDAISGEEDEEDREDVNDNDIEE